MTFEQITLSLKNAWSGTRRVLVAGTARRVIVKNRQGDKFLEVPMTVAIVITIVAPYVTGLGALAALILQFTLAIETRTNDQQSVVRQRSASRR